MCAQLDTGIAKIARGPLGECGFVAYYDGQDGAFAHLSHSYGVELLPSSQFVLHQFKVLHRVGEHKPPVLPVEWRIQPMYSSVMVGAQQYKVTQIVFAASAEPSHMMAFAQICLEDGSRSPPT